jgi:hypothetical protein
MQFLYPMVLWGLAALAIPVIIHLFRLRRFKIVLFSSTRLLRDVQIETRRKSRIRNLIILLLRMLALSALVIAFSRPFIPHSGRMAEGEEHKTVVIYVDNSFSMEAGEAYHSRLNAAKNKTMEIVSGFSQSDRFVLLSNSQDAASFRPLNQRQFSDKLALLGIAPWSNTFSNTLLRMAEVQNQIPASQILSFVISDFQYSFFNTESLPDSVHFPLFIVPVEGAPVSNAGIDSVWLDSPVLQPGSQVVVNVRVRNYSDESYEAIPVELFVNNSRRSVASVDLSPGGIAYADMSFVPQESGMYACHVQIQDAPVTYDDKLYFSFQISESVNVLAIWGKDRLNQSVSAIFRNEPLFSFSQTSSDRLQVGQIPEANLVVLDAVENPSGGMIQELETFVRDGGSLVIVPSAKDDGGNINSLMSRLGLDRYGKISPSALRIAELNMSHELFKGVFEGIPRDMDLPAVQKYISISETGFSWRMPLMKLQNGDPFLIMSSVGNGFVYYFTAPFEQSFTDFHKHAIVVPVFYQMAFLSRRQAELYYTIGRNEAVIFSGDQVKESKGNMFRITGGNDIDFIPQVKTEGTRTTFFVHSMIEEAGNYIVTSNEEPVQSIAFNYSRDESQMKFYTRHELDSIFRARQLKNVDILDGNRVLTSDIQMIMQGRQLWKIFLLCALIFLAIEVILLRFWK